MIRLPLALALLLGASAASLPPAPPARTYCSATVYQDYVLGITYYAIVSRGSDCRPQDVARVRKTSTLSTRAAGAAYQPIRPLNGAWLLTFSGGTIPNDAHWTLYNWRWEYYDGQHWLPADVR